MYCSRCGTELAPGAAFCSKCGASTVVAAAPTGVPAPVNRPPIITVLAVLQFIGAVACVVTALVCFAALGGGGTGPIPAAMAGVFLAVFGALQLACGLGLWKLKPYGRTLQIVFAVIGLFMIPVGTIIAILILVYLSKPGIKVLFSGKPADVWTAEESAQVAAISQSSLAAVIVAVVLVVGLVIVTGIVAAIAVPGLLRARMVANETSAIASLRTINSAQAAFAATCGNGFYAPTLASLAAPPKDGGQGFLSSDLAADPVIKSGYRIALTAGEPVATAPVACNGARVVASYFAAAAPTNFGATGTRFFATNQETTLYQSPSAIRVTQSGAPANTAPIF